MSVTGVCLLAAAAATAAPAPIPRTHEFALGLGGSSNGAYMLFAWTSPLRVGAYLRLFPGLQNDDEQRPNSVLTDESAGEVGIAVRIRPWITVGAGYGSYERTTTSYGDPDWLFGIPVFLGEEIEEDNGPAALAVFSLPSASRNVAFDVSVSLSPAGSGVAIGCTFRR